MLPKSKLTDSERSAYRELLTKYGHKEAEFELHEENLSRSADGRLNGFIWIIHAQTGRGVVFDLGRFRSDWLDALERTLQGHSFPTE